MEPGENTVGTHVSVDHIGATLENDTVEITIEITNIEGRAIHLKAEVVDSLEKVGKGIHHRFVVDVDKTCERLKEKSEKVFG